jgi:hypothetical protein
LRISGSARFASPAVQISVALRVCPSIRCDRVARLSCSVSGPARTGAGLRLTLSQSARASLGKPSAVVRFTSPRDPFSWRASACPLASLFEFRSGGFFRLRLFLRLIYRVVESYAGGTARMAPLEMQQFAPILGQSNCNHALWLHFTPVSELDYACTNRPLDPQRVARLGRTIDD